MVGRYPLAVIVMDADSLLLDVNVHPSKKEIRISKEKELGELIQSAVAAVLRTEERIPSGIENLKFKRQSPLEPVRTEQLSVSFRSFDQEVVQETETKLPATNEYENFRSLETAFDNGPVHNGNSQREQAFVGSEVVAPSEGLPTTSEEQEVYAVPFTDQPTQDHDEPNAPHVSIHPKNPVAHEEPIMKTVQKVEAEAEKGPASKRPSRICTFSARCTALTCSRRMRTASTSSISMLPRSESNMNIIVRKSARFPPISKGC